MFVKVMIKSHKTSELAALTVCSPRADLHGLKPPCLRRSRLISVKRASAFLVAHIFAQHWRVKCEREVKSVAFYSFPCLLRNLNFEINHERECISISWNVLSM